MNELLYGGMSVLQRISLNHFIFHFYVKHPNSSEKLVVVNMTISVILYT